jgi:hypothetical protein
MATTQPSYLREWLTSQGNVYALLGAAAAAAVLSIPFGFGIGAMPLIAFAAGEAIGALYVPSSLAFRSKVDRRHRAAQRNASRDHLIEEIRRRVRRKDDFDRTLATYGGMTQRVASLYALAAEGRTPLLPGDVEKLEDASLDYLCVRLALLIIDDRSAAIDGRQVQERVDSIERELAAQRPGSDVQQLHKARNDYLALAARHRRMQNRKAALDAALLSMPDQMEEIYQTIVTAPTSDELGNKLSEAVAKLRLQEDIEAELAGDIESAVPGLVVSLNRPPANARRVAAALQRQA